MATKKRKRKSVAKKPTQERAATSPRKSPAKKKSVTTRKKSKAAASQPKKKGTATKKSPRKKSATKTPATTPRVAKRKSAKKKQPTAFRDVPVEDVQPLRPAPGEMIIRMYRQGLGDCFLLAFGTAQPSEPRYVLIDCGVHMRQEKGKERLDQVMRHLRAATGSSIHVVIATHEHADHLSGFVQKASPFLDDAFNIDQLWVAWTEKFGDPDADRLRGERASARDVIAKAVKKARAKNSDSMTALATKLDGLMDFETIDDEAFDEDHHKELAQKIKFSKREHDDLTVRLRGFRSEFGGAAEGLAAAGNKKKRKRPGSNELALGLLAWKAKTVNHCNPGDVLTIPSVPGVRVFALGPPKNELFLKKDLPSKVRGGHEHEYKETYLSGSVELNALNLAPALNDDPRVHKDLQHPFASEFRRSLKKRSKGDPRDEHAMFDQTTYDFFQEHYFGAKNKWRSIDGDWLGPAEQLALHLDSDTNNTSLSLAFELGEPGDGEVLIFPGDAQVGNWLSWREQSYGSGEKTMTADDLLSRTLVYKVGHHGSHNATLKNYIRPGSREDGEAYGLELMDDIISMIPVDRAAADRPMPTPWRMPHHPLYRRLRLKSDRRVLRSDQSTKPLTGSAAKDEVPNSTQWTSVPGKRGLAWRKSVEEFKLGTKGPLYYDIRIPIRSAD